MEELERKNRRGAQVWYTEGGPDGAPEEVMWVGV